MIWRVVFSTLMLLATTRTAGLIFQSNPHVGEPAAFRHPSLAASAKEGSTRANAAERNRISSVELSWVFGGRPQQGWVLYIPLICEAIGVDAEIESDAFTEALARWQGRSNLPQTGIMDSESWHTLMTELQSRRIKSHECPAKENMVVAPASDFYDSERPPELRRVERAGYSAYRSLIDKAVRDGLVHFEGTQVEGARAGVIEQPPKYLKIISSFRSREYQDQLRKSAPRAGRAALAVNSPHFTGRALDLYVGGEPVSTKYNNRLTQTRTEIYRWLVKNAPQFGFHPYFYEPWHWEYVGAQGKRSRS